MGRVLADFPISWRKRTVVRLRRPQALSLSVKALWHLMHQNRRLYSTNSTSCPRKGTSRLHRGRTSCCFTHIAPQCGHVSLPFVAITSTRSFPSTCTSCLRIRRPSNSKGTTIPAAWLGSSSVVCWLGIACPPVTWCFCSYQVQRRTSRLLRFLPKSPQRMQSLMGRQRDRIWNEIVGPVVSNIEAGF